MNKMKLNSILAAVLALTMSLACLTGCSSSSTPKDNALLPTGGVIHLSVNPEISVAYDENGNVTKVEAKNDDATAILASFSGYEGKACRQVVADLVAEIGKAGYFVEEIEGQKRQISIEIDSGSSLPYETFLDEVVGDVRECVNRNDWASPVAVKGESNYGITDYVDTDYGPDNDGVTDYNDNNTDYGPNNDGVTDYNDTDYGPNNDGVTDYNDTDYGPNNDGVTDFNDGNSNYSSSSNYDNNSNYSSSSDYKNGNSDYDN